MPPALVTARFQIPLREDGDLRRQKGTTRARSSPHTGPLHGRPRWQLLQRTLTSTFGGWTLVGTVVGEWYDAEAGHAGQEESRLYEVDVPSDRVHELEALLRRCCITFVQKCVRLVIHGRPRYVWRGPHDEVL